MKTKNLLLINWTQGQLRHRGQSHGFIYLSVCSFKKKKKKKKKKKWPFMAIKILDFGQWKVKQITDHLIINF